MLEILADSQQKTRDTYLLRGHVEIRYRGITLKADEVTYNETSGEATSQGHVEFARDTEELRSEAATYNLHTGRGKFTRVRGSLRVEPRPDPNLLLSPNPFYFEADWVERREDGRYIAHHGWVTNCTPESAKWKLRASRAEIQPGERVTLFGSSFHLGPVPLFFSPFLTHSLQRRPRQSGFLLPSVGNNSRKGFTVGESCFWAHSSKPHMLVGAENLIRRGWSRQFT
jgi:LPS-assembly protein